MVPLLALGLVATTMISATATAFHLMDARLRALDERYVPPPSPPLEQTRCELTPGERDILAYMQERWNLTREVRSGNMDEATQAVYELYARLGRRRQPQVLWVASPYAGMLEHHQLRDARRSRLKPLPLPLDHDAMRLQVLGPHRYYEVAIHMSLNGHRREHEAIRRLVLDSLRRASLEFRQRHRRLINDININEAFCICLDAALPTLRMQSFFDRIGLLDAPPYHEALQRLAAVAGWVWLFEDVAIVSAPACRARFELGAQLHCEDGPAIVYPDDWSVYVWHGVEVSRELIECPQQMSPAAIMAERDVEMRRIMIERFGAAPLMKALEPTVLDRDRDAHGERRLLRLDLDQDEPLVMVEVRCNRKDGKIDTYHLRVPPDTLTCADAVAWTFGKEKSDYKPAFES
jgi:hypothetical protein